jgi:hypothetical protein
MLSRVGCWNFVEISYIDNGQFHKWKLEKSIFEVQQLTVKPNLVIKTMMR